MHGDRGDVGVVVVFWNACLRWTWLARCYVSESSAVSVMTSSSDVEFSSGDGVLTPVYISGREGDGDEVIFVEEPRAEGSNHVEPPVVEVYSAVPDVTFTSESRLFQLPSTTTVHQPWIKSMTPGHGSGDRKSSPVTSTTAVRSDNEPARVKSADEEFEVSVPNYVALAVNVALLAGIVFVVAVFLAVVVSVVLHRRRQQYPRDVTAMPTSAMVPAVSRPRIKPTSPGAKHASFYPPADKPRLFVSVSKVGDPKEWFV